MKPAFSYYGGKQRMLPNILPLIPKHTVYVEPFAGGASVFFGKSMPNVGSSDHYREVLNDLDGRIVNFYRVCQDKNKRRELLDRLAFTPYARDEHRRALHDDQKTDVDKAWAWFVNVQMSFSNTPSSGWRTSVFGENTPATWKRQIERLLPACERLSGVHIESDDAVSVIERWDSPQTLFYCDPPYPGSDQMGYKHKYSHSDFSELVDTLENAEGSFLLSAYDVGLCPGHWEKYEFSAHMSAQNSKDRDANRERTEVVWRRDNHVNSRPEIMTLYQSGAFDCFGGPEYVDMAKRVWVVNDKDFTDLPMFEGAK